MVKADVTPHISTDGWGQSPIQHVGGTATASTAASQ